MMTTCTVHFSKSSDKVIALSGALLKQFNLAGRKTVQVKCGHKEATAKLKAVKRQGNHVYISGGLKARLHIPKSGVTSLMQAAEDVLQFGPLIGILSDSAVHSQSSPFGYQTPLVKSIIRSGNNKAYCFGFTPRDINFGSGTVNGWFLGAAGWYRRLVPLPDAVYNRMPSRRGEFSGTMKRFRERLVQQKIPFFNWSFFNKSDVYRMLEHDVEALEHMPESVNNPRGAKLKEMLDKHHLIYYKPTAGSLGIGIYRLTYSPRKGYYARYRRGGSNALVRFGTFNSLWRMLQARHGSQLRRYVAQQGIRLIEMNGCPIDFRFHMHKNGNNEWVPVGIGGKKAGRGSVTTHVKNGGTLLTPERALREAFGADAEEVLNYAKKVSVKLSEAIERNHPHTLGELGLDIGIDQEGRVWMFEANAKPGRSIFHHPSLRGQGRDSFQHVVDHCMYLSNFREGTYL
jgi:hypothetical protein